MSWFGSTKRLSTAPSADAEKAASEAATRTKRAVMDRAIARARVFPRYVAGAGAGVGAPSPDTKPTFCRPPRWSVKMTFAT